MKKLILASLLAVLSLVSVNAQRVLVSQDDWGRFYGSNPEEIFLQNTGGSGGHSVNIAFFQYGNAAGVGNCGCILSLEDWGGVYSESTFNGLRIKLSNGKIYILATKNPEDIIVEKDGTKRVIYRFSSSSDALELFKKYRVLAAGVVTSSSYNRNPRLDAAWWNKLNQNSAIKIQRQARYMSWDNWSSLWKR